MANTTIFSQINLNWALPVGVIIVFLVIFLLGVFMLLGRYYKRCPSNKLLIIYGKGTGRSTNTKIVHGGASFVVPLLQDYAYLSLDPMQIEVPLRGALSIENIRVNVPSVFTVAVSTDTAVRENAAVRLLGLPRQEVVKQASEIIFGQLRQVIASMAIEDINRDREKFLQHIQSSLEPELNKVGLQLINVNITDITDESGYIDAIGQKAASEAIQKARGDVADNEKMGEIRVANAEREKSVKVAEARRDQSIGTREAERDRAVKVAALEKEQAIGEQTAAFLRESEVKEREREMRVRVADADAQAIDGENQAQASIAASRAELAVREAEAYERGQSRQKQAKAKVIEVENQAMAAAALAEAARIEAEKRAQLEAPAKAEKAKIIVDAEAEAQRRLIIAKAEADAVFAKLEAEARGQYEILAKKGEGLREIVNACGGSQQAFQMLMLEHLDNLADASARAISNIKFDKIVVWEGGGENGHTSTANFLKGMAKTMPPMLQVMRDIGGVELPEALVKLGADAPSVATPGHVVNGDAAEHAVAKGPSNPK